MINRIYIKKNIPPIFLKICGGSSRSYAIEFSKILYGNGTIYGTTGTGDSTIHKLFYKTNTDYKWNDVQTPSSGGNHTLLLRDDNTLWAYGPNDYGQLGVGNTEMRIKPIQIGYETWNKIATGAAFSFGIKNDGTLWATGDNYHGVLGLGDNSNATYLSFTNVGYDSNWSDISAGEYHSVGVKQDGTLWACGYNEYGELGLSTSMYNIKTFTKIGTDTNWKNVICGTSCTFIIKNDGTLWACGENYFGQLGLGDFISEHDLFTQVGIGSDILKISTGSFHSFVIKQDGTLWACGDNSSGQLGIPSISTKINLFTQVGTDSDWKDVSCGQNNTLALKVDGTLWVCGDNNEGQLGLGNTNDYNEFTLVQKIIR